MIGAYALVAADDEVLYVGSSVDVSRRILNHRNTADFWSEVEDVWPFPTEVKAEAQQLEKHLIHTLRPAFNKYYAGFIECRCGCGITSAQVRANVLLPDTS